MKRKIISVILIMCLVVISAGCKADKSDDKKEVTLNYYSHVDENGTLTNIINKFHEENPNIKVNVVELPADTNKKLQMISTALQAEDDSLDMFDADVTWPPIFASAGWVTDLTDELTQDEKDKYLPGAINANIYQGKLWGLPYRIDAGMLYYRKDLLEKYNKTVPETWEELVETATYIMENEPDMKGLAGSWKQYEGLTCNLMEYVWSYGGDVFDENGKVIYNSPETIKATKMMVDMINTSKITPEGIINFGSGDARAPFFTGKLIFLRDWPSGWNKSQDADKSQVVGKVGIAELPKADKNGKSYSTLGGWQIMVSKFSKNQEEAIKFAKYMAGEEAEKIEALGLSHLPSIKSLYEDKEILEKMPFVEKMLPVFMNANPRPKSPYYSEISNVLQLQTQLAFIEDKTVEDAVKDADKEIKKIIGQ
ncbi:ABC transporter substrate-binding protein [Vallitalea sediminicola]